MPDWQLRRPGCVIRVKLTFPYPEWPLLRQTPQQSGVWEGYHFYVNEPIEECDYWVVCDHLLTTESTYCPRENIILLTWEPPSIRTYEASFLKQFSKVITSQRGLDHKNVVFSQQAHPW